MKTETDILDNWRQLLKKQIRLAQQGKINEVENLCKDADSLIKDLSGNAPAPEKMGIIKKLYHELCLILTSDMSHIARVLKNSKKNRLATKIYRNNL